MNEQDEERKALAVAQLARSETRAQNVLIYTTIIFLTFYLTGLTFWLGWENVSVRHDVGELSQLEIKIEKIRVSRAQDTNYFSQQNCRTSADITGVMREAAVTRIAVEKSIMLPPIEGNAKRKRIHATQDYLDEIDRIRTKYRLRACVPPKIDSPVVKHASREPAGKK